VNYFAHGRRALGNPYLLAGTALPDWLAACDRAARLRREAVDAAPGDLAEGVRLHLADDRWFHGTEAFLETSGVLARRLRERSGGDPSVRAAFFGHLLTEVLLDATLIAEDGASLDAYYRQLGEVDAERVAASAAGWTRVPPRGLAEFIGRFRRARFLEGYLDDAGLLARLGGVARRLGVPVPPGTGDILPDARRLVAARAGDLLQAPVP
jgi:hypothetical protein